MTAASLTDRYVSAAMRGVPDKQRADLGAELRTSIDDQIDARVEGGETREAAERAVLTELGDPDKLAAGYTDKPQWLIGPRYFFEWWRLLKLLLWIVTPLAAFGIALGQALAGAPFGEIVGSTVSGVLAVVVHLAFWTTLVFALLERHPGRRESALEVSPPTARGPWAPWSVDQLPEPRHSGAGLSDVIASLVFLALAVVVIVWDHLLGFVPTVPGLSFLDPALWPWWIAGLFAVMVLEGILQVVVYARGRWTIPLAIVNALLNLVVAVPALWLLSEGSLINPDFWTTILPAEAAQLPGIIVIITGFLIAAIAIWDTLDAFLKARRSGPAT